MCQGEVTSGAPEQEGLHQCLPEDSPWVLTVGSDTDLEGTEVPGSGASVSLPVIPYPSDAHISYAICLEHVAHGRRLPRSPEKAEGQPRWATDERKGGGRG